METFLDTMKVILSVVGILLIGLLVVALLYSCSAKIGEEAFQEKIEGYSTIVVNGEEYEIKDIIEIHYEEGGYSEDKIEIILTDGTKVTFPENAYTLKK